MYIGLTVAQKLKIQIKKKHNFTWNIIATIHIHIKHYHNYWHLHETLQQTLIFT